MEKLPYNPYDHNHIEWPDERLQDRISELSKNHREISYSEPRKSQVEREMSIIAFELSERLREAKNEQINEAWSEHGTMATD